MVRFPDKHVHWTPSCNGEDCRIVGYLSHEHPALAINLLSTDRQVIARFVRGPAFFELRCSHSSYGPAWSPHSLVRRHLAFFELRRHQTGILLASLHPAAKVTRKKCQRFL